MEISLLVDFISNVSVVFFAGIFLVAAGLFFLDRDSIQKRAANTGSFEDRNEESGEDRRAA